MSIGSRHGSLLLATLSIIMPILQMRKLRLSEVQVTHYQVAVRGEPSSV